MVLQGDTIKLKVQFRNYNGDTIDITNPICNIYSLSDNSLLQSITDITHVGVGMYECYYAPTEDFIFEMSGELSGNTILNRQAVKVMFCNS